MTVDPLHESIVGHDVPYRELYDLPDVLDREITVSAHLDVGLGISGKGSIGGNIGRTGDSNDGIAGAHFSQKARIGSVVGYGASIVID